MDSFTRKRSAYHTIFAQSTTKLPAILALAVLALVVVPRVSADTFDFSFTSVAANYSGLPITNGEYSGSGSFDTLPLPDPSMSAYDAYQLTSLTGELNGAPMSLISAYQTALDASGLFLNHSLNFTVNGETYRIFDNDHGPPEGNDLVGNFAPNVQAILIDLTVTPVSTPEPSSFLLLGLGLLALAGLYRRKILA